MKAAKQGFEPKLVPFNVGTGELRNVPIALNIGAATTAVRVTTHAPLLDTSDSRNQVTLNAAEMQALPNPDLSPLQSLDFTPGVVGSVGGELNQKFQNGVPISANGRGDGDGNSVVLDETSVNDSSRFGTIDLTPNQNTFQEVAIQPNTYSVEYGTGARFRW